jgi:predicted protein tyrosine phosphatase
VPLPPITIASYDFAERLLGTAVGRKFTHVISINGVGHKPPGPLRHHPSDQLVLEFDDLGSLNFKGNFQAPGIEHVQKIIDFAQGIDPSSEVMCHCAAGISRSSAAALTIIASKLAPSRKNAEAAISHLLSIKQTIFPNRLMVEYADELLGYGGDLKAVHGGTFTASELIWMPPGLEYYDDEEE